MVWGWGTVNFEEVHASKYLKEIQKVGYGSRGDPTCSDCLMASSQELLPALAHCKAS